VSQLYTHRFVNNKKALIFGEKWDIVGAKMFDEYYCLNIKI
jgi:hypothetical protein